MEGLILVLGGAILGWIGTEHYVKMTMKKLHKEELRNAYHLGFEKGVEKGRNDYEAELRAFSQRTLEEQVKEEKELGDVEHLIGLDYDSHQHDESCSHDLNTQTYKPPVKETRAKKKKSGAKRKEKVSKKARR